MTIWECAYGDDKWDMKKIQLDKIQFSHYHLIISSFNSHIYSFPTIPHSPH